MLLHGSLQQSVDARVLLWSSCGARLEALQPSLWLFVIVIVIVIAIIKMLLLLEYSCSSVARSPSEKVQHTLERHVLLIACLLVASFGVYQVEATRRRKSLFFFRWVGSVRVRTECILKYLERR